MRATGARAPRTRTRGTGLCRVRMLATYDPIQVVYDDQCLHADCETTPGATQLFGRRASLSITCCFDLRSDPNRRSHPVEGGRRTTTTTARAIRSTATT